MQSAVIEPLTAGMDVAAPVTTPVPVTIPISKPWLDDREALAAGRPLRSGWVTQGPEVAAFEREFGEFVGATHACAVSSCTTALHLALLVAGVGPGDEVITVSHSYIATANSVRYCGAIPVFIDVERGTYNMDPRLIEQSISPKTRAILCVHQMGLPCDLEAILAIAKRHALPVIEDAACASGSEVLFERRWERIGKPHGHVACFSFHPRKVITTGDGGMLTTANADWDQQFRLLRQHAMSVSDTVRHNAAQVIFESYPTVGYNYRMTDIQAAIGREQVAKLPEILARRRYLAARYGEALQGIAGVTAPRDEAFTRSNWQSYCVRLAPGIDQVALMQKMLEAGIATRRGIMCAHREPAYQDAPEFAASSGPALGSTLLESERAQDETVLLPLYVTLTDREQDRVIQALRSAVL